MRSIDGVPAHNLKTTRKGKVKRRSLLWRWRRMFYLVVLAFTVLVAGAVYVVSRVQLPVDPSVAPLQRQTSFICSADVQTNCNASNAMARLHGAEDRSVVSYGQIPTVLRQAVVSAEDRDFFKHGGVDPTGIARAAWADIRNKGSRQGGSTITQQYVKNTFLNRERTLTRKIKESVMAIKLEQKLSKREILGRYLNTIYFGRGAYGVQAASRAWFGHDVETVSLPEAAFMAGLIRAPESADPSRGPGPAKEGDRRRRSVLRAMRDQGYITAPQAVFASAVPLPVVRPVSTANLGENVRGEEIGTKYFIEYVRRFLVRRFGEDAVYGGGLKVYTTIDLRMQKAAWDAVTTTLDRPEDPSAAIVAVDDHGQVKAMMGGKDFARSHVNLAVGREGGGSGRQPGSTFKAFALAEAVKEGYSIESVFRSPSSIDIPNGLGPGRPWTVRGGYGAGSATLIKATQRSINTVYAQLAAVLGIDKVIDMAHELGVSAKAGSLPPVPSIVLGSGSVSVLDMTAAYSTFANQGQRRTPIVVSRVERPDGTVVDFNPDGVQVLTPDQAGRVTYCLQQVVKGGTGTAAAFGRPAAGKTGTTSDNKDAWFVGFTPKLTAAVWMGYPGANGQEVKPMQDVHGVTVQGGSFPAQMWRKFMQSATANIDTGTFPDPGPLDVGTLINPDLSAASRRASAPSPPPAPSSLSPAPSTASTAPATAPTVAPTTVTTAPTVPITTTTAATPTTPSTRPTTSTTRPTTTTAPRPPTTAGRKPPTAGGP